MKKHLLNCMKVFAAGLLSMMGVVANAQVTINSFTPTSGPVGATVTINGSGFNTLLGSNAVFFGTVPASIQSIASSTQMTVTVPAGANYQYILASNLTAGLIGTTGYSSKPFVVTYSPNGSNTFRSKSSLTSGSSASARNVYFADMNNDGKPDLVIANSNNTISIFPNQTTSSTGTASFGSAVNLGTASGSVSAALALGDADSDGKLDIMAVFSGTSSVAFYRNTTASVGATPSFAGVATFGTAASPIAINMVDFDGDGNSDLVVASNLSTNNVSVLRNLGLVLGSLSFLGAQTFSAGTNPNGIAIGDIDGDGNIDIAVSNRNSNNVSVLRNTSTLLGGINFAGAVALTAGSSPTAVAIGDFDGDNKLDLATSNGLANSISILRNTSTSGNISFTAKSDFSLGANSGAQHLGLGDTNGDSKVDIVSANLGNSTVSVLRNASSSGSISFSINVDVSNAGSTSPTSIAVGDINADSKPDLILATSGTSNNVSIFLQKVTQALTITSAGNLAVDASLSITANRSVTPTFLGGNLSYAITAGSGSATVNSSGNLTAISVGTITLTVTAAGATDYDAASATQLVSISKVTPTLSVSVSSTLVVDGSMTGTTVTTATLGRGGNVSYALVAGSGSATVNATTGLIRGVRVGTVTLTSTAAGDTNYYSANRAQVIAITKATPTMMFTSVGTVRVDNAITGTVSTTATLGRGGNVSYALVAGSGSATINGATGLLKGISAGTLTMTATSAGDTDYYSISSAQLVLVNKTTPTLQITSAGIVPVKGSLTLSSNSSATLGRGGVVSYSISVGSGSATLNPNTGVISAYHAGSLTLTASSAGDADYYPSSAIQTLALAKADPTLVFTSPLSMSVDDFLTVSATSTTGEDVGALSYDVQSGTGTALFISADLLAAVAAGQLTLTVNSAGSADYNPGSLSLPMIIGRATPTLSITSADTMNMNDVLLAEASTSASFFRGGAITFEIVAGGGSATVDPSTNMITALGAGTVTLIARSAGDGDYNTGFTEQILTINATTPTLSFTSFDRVTVNGILTATVASSAPFGRGGAISYAIEMGSGSASIDAQSGLVTGVSVGTVTLTATSAGDTDYAPSSVSQLLSIDPTTPTLTITSIDRVLVDGSLTASAISSAPLGRGGAISYAIAAGSGSATIDENTGLIIGVSAGTLSLTAFSVGDADYLPSSTTQLFTVDKATPTLIITSPDVLGLNASMNIIAESNATLNRGGAFSYAAEAGSGSATIDPATGLVTGLSTGTVTITVASAGDADYYPSLATQLLNVAASTPTLTITSSDQVDVDGTLTATTISSAPLGSGGVITYAIEAGSGSATVDTNSGRVLGISAGTVTLIASSSGDTIYGPSSTSQTLQVNMIAPSFTIVSSADLHVDEIINVAISTTASHDIGLLEYAVENDSGIAYVDESGVLTAFGAGQVTLTVNSLGNADYLPSSTSQLITISKSTPTVFINSIDYVYVDDFIVADATTNATGGRGGYFSFEIIAGSGSATINLDSSQLTGISVGSITLVALTSGDSDYYPGRETQVVNILRATPTLTVLGPYNMVAHESITASVLMSATRNRGGAINYFIQAGSGSATVDPDTGLITSIHAGTVTLEVTSAGDTDFYPTSAQQEISIDKIMPALAIISDANLFVDQTLAVSGTTSAAPGFGGDFYYVIETGSGSATVDVNTGLITAIGAGTVTLVLHSLGDADYYPASVTQTLFIEKVTPTLNITTTAAEVDNDFTIGVQSSATGGRGGSLTYHIEAGSGSATVDAVTGFVHPLDVGTVTLTVTSAGDADYHGTSVSRLLTIAKGTPTIVITSSNTLAVDGTMTITYTSSAAIPGAVSYSGQNGTGIVVVVSNTGKVTGVQVGTAVVKVSTAGSANYNPVTVSMSITLVKATPTLTITAPSGSTMVRGTSLTVTFVTSATFSRGGAKSYAVSAGTGSATINATTGRLTAVTAGSISITVSTAGDANYYQRSQSKVITITPAMMSVGPVVTQPEDKFNPESSFASAGQSEELGASSIADQEKVAVTRLISPNGDGLNDLLTISHIEDYPGNEVVIANRDGEMVFKVHGYDNSAVVFSGRSNTGTTLPNGVYYYTLSYFEEGQLKQRAGYFELRR